MTFLDLSALKKYARLAKPQSLRSALGSWRRREDFRDIQSFAFFLGYMRSGHTLVGSLLNAHPNIVISNELGALSLLAKGYSKDQVFYLCLEKDKKFEKKNRTWTGYKYQVDGQYQGEFENLRVVGDKNGATAAYGFDRRPDLFKIMSNLDVKVKVIHHTRNPFDIISTGHQKAKGGGTKSVQDVEAYFFRWARKIEETIETLKKIDNVSVKTSHHKNLILESKSTVRSLVEFMGERVSSGYLNSCDDLIFDDQKKTRFGACWSDSQIRKVESKIGSLKYFPDYEFGA
jgi:hypothetical protein